MAFFPRVRSCERRKVFLSSVITCPGGDRTHRVDSLEKTLLELGRIQCPEDAPEGIMRGNAMGEGQELFEPSVFSLSKRFHRHPIVGPTDDRTNGAHQNVPLRVQFSTVDPRIIQRGKIVFNRNNRIFSHRILPVLGGGYLNYGNFSSCHEFRCNCPTPAPGSATCRKTSKKLCLPASSSEISRDLLRSLGLQLNRPNLEESLLDDHKACACRLVNAVPSFTKGKIKPQRPELGAVCN